MNLDPELERLFKAALGRVGEPAPFSVDVCDRVMSRIARIGPPVPADVGFRELVPWAVAATLLGAALLSVAVWRGPSAHELAVITAQAITTTTGTSTKLAGPLGSLAGSAMRVASALVESARTTIQPLTPFQPLARALLAAVAAAMLGITTLVVGRDLRSGIAQKEQP